MKSIISFRTLYLWMESKFSLRGKFIVAIGTIISVSYMVFLYRTSLVDNELIILQAQQQARMLYNQILITRQWVSEHNGLFVIRKDTVNKNPYLDLPSIRDQEGNEYVMRNPAMVTRELSEYSQDKGLGSFRVTSLHPVNPENGPDEFEKLCMINFDHGFLESIAIRDTPQGRVVRYMAPLETKDSCLGCHARHGYSQGDIRGALSITIPIAWADEKIQANNRSLFIIGFISFVLVSITLLIMFNTLVVSRLDRLSTAIKSFPETEPDQLMLPFGNDEIGHLSDHFSELCQRIVRYQKEIETTRQQTLFNEKMASMGILSAGIAHEVNNPLGGMLNLVKSMRENPEDFEMHERYLPLLHKGLKQIEHTMRQLLNFGRQEPLQLRKINVATLLGECLELLSYKLKGIVIHQENSIEQECYVDAEALKQIFVNLGLNAIQAMPDGGSLHIRSEMIEQQLRFTFTDTGTGIAEDILTHIFDPFFTTKDVGVGTGLGLSVTYTLVGKMKGTVAVTSEEGTGTTFTVTIPEYPQNTMEI
ncbi:signal transduction histidine kinase [Desulfocapsa sulfexigens DSM 10523]|uniref:histidine kinase n=1 Tax=Desulfocapsa sulfexigens (strain DSM 10523 / SB164P1) TaxID=1167006 RepID=M1P5Q4_DESSD|nr:ATP-binding protein [Desulfocapsa sulfexigens]AGF78828.1 signal transduction histidine kinase [Desulfocapsa sulfexigens DSM 10523]